MRSHPVAGTEAKALGARARRTPPSLGGAGRAPGPLRVSPLSRQKVSSGEGTRGCHSARRRRQKLEREPRRSRGSGGAADGAAGQRPGPGAQRRRFMQPGRLGSGGGGGGGGGGG
uniref:Uncharacterized protein n=1 Tax=Rangifer tarandus platyrhynchus TaxID=3082113 RepID=A0ACB0F9C0_RANTA|nr:unnamed protein product [Rangifer tarandus platyrhynchus]